MKYLKLMVIGFVSISMVFNFILLGKVKDLSRQIMNLQSENQQIQSSINSIPGQINNFLHQVKQLESWITPITIETTSLSSNQINLKANWQIKEYHQDAKVSFHVKSNGKDFRNVEAINKGNGYFESHFIVTADLEPMWEVHAQSSEKIAEQSIKEDKDEVINYYVSVEQNGNIKSSEIANFNARGLSYQKYGVLMVDIFKGKQSNYNITLNNFNKSDSSEKIKSVTLKAYKNGEFLSSQELENNSDPHPQGAPDNYNINYQSEEADRLELEVNYQNGASFSKEIYSE